MRLFVLGAPCSGKTTVAACLRRHGLVALDVDDEIERLNGGTWPDIDTKNERYLPMVLDAAAAISEVVLFNSYMPLDRTRQLRASGFTVVLLDVSESEIRRRDRVRVQAEGRSNIEWFDWHQAVILEHHQAGLIDHVIDGQRDTGVVAADLTALLRAPR